MSSKATCIAWTNGAIVRAVAGFTAFVAYRSFHSRAVASVVDLWFERAFAIGALVFWTRDAQNAFASVSRAAAFAAFGLTTFGCCILMFRTCCARRICTLLVSVYAQDLCIACSIWRTCSRRCSAIQSHNERRPCGKIIAEIESKS